MKRISVLTLAISAVFGLGTAQAGPIQVLLDEDFQDVTGLTTAGTVRTVQHILTNNPTQLPAGTAFTFTNAGTGDATASSFNVRRGDNPIDGTIGPPTFGNTSFDNFFGGATNHFLVIGDDTGNLGGSPNGGGGTSSSLMRLTFPFATLTLHHVTYLTVAFDYVFDANNTNNPDDFLVDLILADNSVVNLLTHTAPSASTRGSFNTTYNWSSFSAAPVALRFSLTEYGGNGSSAVGLDNIKVQAIPEPGALALLGMGLLALG
ncbi:MAG: hypothetical protein NZ524_08465, partial [Thiobacillaceae bacterium]|nr:hypothetical protein [Thiobacillaceae bacterium]